MPEKKTVFITGVTGLVGSYLLKTLLQNNHKVYALARNKENKGAKDRVVEVLKF
jgi:thioester reductase-like protein